VGERGRLLADGVKTPDRLIFVEHNHVYTLGKSGSEQNLLLDYIQLQARDCIVLQDRQGWRYHLSRPRPACRVYPIFDLEGLGIGLREYIQTA
jgi:lipoyl(octanoyl) transferase